MMLREEDFNSFAPKYMIEMLKRMGIVEDKETKKMIEAICESLVRTHPAIVNNELFNSVFKK